jgi:RNA polymerase sigma-70 factor (ECF subfamily)
MNPIQAASWRVFVHGVAAVISSIGVARVGSDQGDDADLLNGLLLGDRDCLAALYDRYASLLLALGRRILGDRREAEDLLHDVFLEAWHKALDYDERRGTVRAWLLMRMRSRALDRRKAAVFSRRAEAPSEDAMGQEDLALTPDRERVRRALNDLPLEQRQVLELGYFEGLSSSEIAARLHAPIGTVKSRVAAALAKLRAGFDPALAASEGARARE